MKLSRLHKNQQIKSFVLYLVQLSRDATENNKRGQSIDDVSPLNC